MFVGVAYLPDMGKSRQVRQEAFELLQRDLMLLCSKGAVVLVGDFNARVGRADDARAHVGMHGEEVINNNGELLLDLLHSVDLYVLNGRVPSARGTEYTLERRNGRSVIDFIIATPDVAQAGTVPATAACVLSATIGATDHMPVFVSVQRPVQRRRVTGIKTRVNVQPADFRIQREVQPKLQNLRAALASVGEGFVDFCTAQKQRVAASEATPSDAVKQAHEELLRVVKGAVLESYGYKRVWAGKSQPWWCQELTDAVAARSAAFERARSSAAAADWHEYERLRKQVHKMVEHAKKQHASALASNITAAYDNRVRDSSRLGEKDMWRLVNKLCPKKSTNDAFLPIRHPAGGTATSDYEIADAFRCHYQRIGSQAVFTASNPSLDNAFMHDVQAAVRQHLIDSHMHTTALDHDITREEVQACQLQLQTGKAGNPLEYEVANEILKHGGAAMTNMLHAYCTLMWELETVHHVPGFIKNLPKQGDLSDPSNYRGITLLSVLYKFYTCVLNRRLIAFAEGTLPGLGRPAAGATTVAAVAAAAAARAPAAAAAARAPAAAVATEAEEMAAAEPAPRAAAARAQRAAWGDAMAAALLIVVAAAVLGSGALAAVAVVIMAAAAARAAASAATPAAAAVPAAAAASVATAPAAAAAGAADACSSPSVFPPCQPGRSLAPAGAHLGAVGFRGFADPRERACDPPSCLHESQNGFRPGRSCADHQFVLHSIMCARKQAGLDTYALFVDVKKAFPSVWLDGLWLQMWQHGVRGKMLRVLHGLYQGASRVASFNDFPSSPFECDVGVHEGDCISPTLYLFFADSLLSEVWEKHPGVQLPACADVEPAKVVAAMLADDFVAVCASLAEAKAVAQTISEHSMKWRYALNADKSALMHVRANSKAPVVRDSGIVWGGVAVPVVTEYRYLGLWFQDDCKWSKHFAEVMQKADARVKRLMPVWLSRRIKVEVKRVVLLSLVRPVFEFGAEVWVPDAAQCKAIDKVQTSIIKSAMHMSKENPSSDGLLAEWGLRPMHMWLHERAIEYFCRVQRMPAHRLPRQVLVCMPANAPWVKKVRQLVARYGVDESVFVRGLVACKSHVKSRIKAACQDRLRAASVSHSTVERYVQWVHPTVVDRFDLTGPATYLRACVPTKGVELCMRIRLGCLCVHERVAKYARRNAPLCCPACQAGNESLEHFVFECPAYAALRAAMFGEIKQLLGSRQSKVDECCNLQGCEKVYSLVSTRFWGKAHGCEVSCVVAKFLDAAWKHRNACKHNGDQHNPAPSERGADGSNAMA